MSFWIHGKDKDGKAILWQVDIPIPLIVVFVGLLAALIAPRTLQIARIMIWLPFALSAAGLALLFISKISLFRKGIWLSFGPRQMSRGYGNVYKAGYALLGLGVLLLLLTWNALR